MMINNHFDGRRDQCTPIRSKINHFPCWYAPNRNNPYWLIEATVIELWINSMLITVMMCVRSQNFLFLDILYFPLSRLLSLSLFLINFEQFIFVLLDKYRHINYDAYYNGQVHWCGMSMWCMHSHISGYCIVIQWNAECFIALYIRFKLLQKMIHSLIACVRWFSPEQQPNMNTRHTG